MNETVDAAREAATEPEAPPVPWLDPGIQQRMQWRDGDVVISVPIKSGTTWTMNIVHQLREGGDTQFEDVYVEVPWPEFLPSPDVSCEQAVHRLDSMPPQRRRVFKTHSPPGPLPYFAPGSGTDVRYIVVARHPDEVLASMYPFIGSHSQAWFDLWGIERNQLAPPTFAEFCQSQGRDMISGAVFGFAEAWWPLRNNDNVMLLHFSDMKRDHEGSVRRVADFLGYAPSAEQWSVILECTSFAWMKAHEERFELRKAAAVPVLDTGAMVRKGKTGDARADGVTAEISAQLAALGREIVSDDAALKWVYEGGSAS